MCIVPILYDSEFETKHEQSDFWHFNISSWMPHEIRINQKLFEKKVQGIQK